MLIPSGTIQNRKKSHKNQSHVLQIHLKASIIYCGIIFERKNLKSNNEYILVKKTKVKLLSRIVALKK